MNEKPEELLAPLRAAVVTAVQQLLAASGAGSVALQLGTGQAILAGETADLARLLGYGTQPFDRLTRQTAAFLAAAGIPHDRLADHGSREWKLFIAGYDCAERAAEPPLLLEAATALESSAHVDEQNDVDPFAVQYARDLARRLRRAAARAIIGKGAAK
ncbi:hypothetical protein OU994_18215 [Pseudoduganella sp. SL102]|uniref:hypothetical protein n=1 Tax=Pseudoduganella sp. SL102 TaxID=2995154 RepID=UPI00248AB027|nr:hypothetical protein [Pseudoduganella sp. SL102]WBS00257.1 hypothetical protein OU994_18215 [Pseudoduganella sp. SL102]